MRAPELQGFFYDEAKCKYFKIQANHLAPNGSRYSREAVQREADEKRFLRDGSSKGERRPHRAQRSPVFNHPLGGGSTLQRETHHQSSSRSPNSRYAAWAHGLSKKSRMETGIEKFVHSEALNSVFFSTSASPQWFQTGFATSNGMYGDLSLNGCASSGFASINMSASRVIMATSMGCDPPRMNGALPGASVLLMNFIEPDCIPDDWTEDWNAWSRVNGLLVSLRPVEQLQMSSKTFWASSVNPSTTDSQFAVAAGDCSMLITQHQGSWHPTSYEMPEESSDLLAVDWLDEKILLNGCRNGKVLLWDTRSTGRDSWSMPIWSPSGVGHVRAFNRNRIVVAGLQNQLNIYDLRYLKPSPVPNSNPITKPFLTFPTYRNHSTPGYKSGFDIHAPSNIIAAASDSGSPCQIFDAGSGQELRVGERNSGTKVTKATTPITCLQFLERAGQKPSLMVASPAGLDEWCW